MTELNLRNRRTLFNFLKHDFPTYGLQVLLFLSYSTGHKIGTAVAIYTIGLSDAASHQDEIMKLYLEEKMKVKHCLKIASFIVSIGLSTTVVSICLAETAIIIGEVNDDCQLVESANGQIYEVAENKIGDDLVNNYISQTVKVTGKVQVKDGIKYITISHFEVISDSEEAN